MPGGDRGPGAQAGAYDYITKPVDPDELSHLVAKRWSTTRAARSRAPAREPQEGPATELIGKSPAMAR